MNQAWSDAKSSLTSTVKSLIRSGVYDACLSATNASVTKWCRFSIYSTYERHTKLSSVICYHFCSTLVHLQKHLDNDSSSSRVMGICPSPCHRQGLCASFDEVSVKCRSTHTVIFNHNFECICKAKFYWDAIRMRCVRLNPCETQKYYPCFRPGTAHCVYDQAKFSHECFCLPAYTGYDCSERYDPCRFVSHSGHVIAVEHPGNRVCNINNAGNRCQAIATNHTYRCLCRTDAWRPDPAMPFDNCLQQVKRCQAIICVRGTCLSSPSGSVGFCRCDEGWGGPNCAEFIGSWSVWSPWDRCRPSCGKYRWTVRTRSCQTKDDSLQNVGAGLMGPRAAAVSSTTAPPLLTSARKDCKGSSTHWLQCPDRSCAHEMDNLMEKIFELRYVLFLVSVVSNMAMGLLCVMIWRFLFPGMLRHQFRLTLGIVTRCFNKIKTPTAQE